MVFLVEEEEERDWRHENNRDWKLIEKKKKNKQKKKRPEARRNPRKDIHIHLLKQKPCAE